MNTRRCRIQEDQMFWILKWRFCSSHLNINSICPLFSLNWVESLAFSISRLRARCPQHHLTNKSLWKHIQLYVNVLKPFETTEPLNAVNLPEDYDFSCIVCWNWQKRQHWEDTCLQSTLPFGILKVARLRAGNEVHRFERPFNWKATWQRPTSWVENCSEWIQVSGDCVWWFGLVFFCMFVHWKTTVSDTGYYLVCWLMLEQLLRCNAIPRTLKASFWSQHEFRVSRPWVCEI